MTSNAFVHQQKKSQASVMELDEMWYFVQKKNTCWVWLACDRAGCRGHGLQPGRCDTATGNPLREPLALVEIGSVCTDDAPVYGKLIPAERDVQTKVETGLSRH